MAAGYLRHLAGESVDVRSAGTIPANAVNPAAVAAMAEEGIDITAQIPQFLTTESVQQADYVITMGCGDTCPYFPGKTYLDWELPDPAGKEIAAVRPIRDAIRLRVEGLLRQIEGSR